MRFDVIVLLVHTALSERLLTIHMPNVDTYEKDAYMCFATSVSDLSDYSLIGYDIDTTKGLTHHIGMAACEDYNSNDTYWDCKHDHGHVCSGRAVSLHGQAGTEVTHTRTSFQEDIGVRLGHDSRINYIILQVHYRNPVEAADHKSSTTNASLILTKERKPYTKQTALLGSNGYIPTMSQNFSCEMITQWKGTPVHVYSYSIHTHDLGVMVEGYLIRNGSPTLIGRHSPKHHGTATYDIEGRKEVVIQPGDIVAARCIFNNPSNKTVQFGNGHSDEMCNFSLNFKYQSTNAMVYSRSIRVYQSCQQVTWCRNDIYMSPNLCQLTEL